MQDLIEIEGKLSFVKGNKRRFENELEDLHDQIAKEPYNDGLVAIARKKSIMIDRIQECIEELTEELRVFEETSKETSENAVRLTKQVDDVVQVSNAIKVIDAPCGEGKTSWAIQEMNAEANNGKNYVFITPFLKEVDRIKSGCKDRRFKSPSKKSKQSKSASLKNLLKSGENIVSTHSLFSRIDAETITLILDGGYILILDEVMDVVRQVPIDQQDIKMLIDQGYIKVEANGNVVATDKAVSYNGRFEDIILDARMNRVLYVDETMLIWQFPTDIFNAFDEVYNLTYMFDGQVQKYYYDFNKVQYSYHSVDCKEGRYKLTDYDPVNGDIEFRRMVKENLRIYDGSLNDIGKDKFDLSVSFYNKASDSILKKIHNNTYNFFRNIHKGNKSNDNMWTCFTNQKEKLKCSGYTKGFVPYNKRATNDYRLKTTLAYLVNRFPRTPINRYFQTKDIQINADLYALSELIQWIWRSQIRDNKPIDLYIPSSRMRGLLRDWINGTVSVDLAA